MRAIDGDVGPAVMLSQTLPLCQSLGGTRQRDAVYSAVCLALSLLLPIPPRARLRF